MIPDVYFIPKDHRLLAGDERTLVLNRIQGIGMPDAVGDGYHVGLTWEEFYFGDRVVRLTFALEAKDRIVSEKVK